MRIHATLVAAVVALVLAVPAVAGAAAPEHHYAPSTVVTSVYPGTSSVSGGCTVTMIDGHVSSFRCPGSTVRQASPGSCTLTVAAGRLWTYSCPGGQPMQGVSMRAIPKSCTAIHASGFFWTFSCPRQALGTL